MNSGNYSKEQTLPSEAELDNNANITLAGGKFSSQELNEKSAKSIVAKDASAMNATTIGSLGMQKSDAHQTIPANLTGMNAGTTGEKWPFRSQSTSFNQQYSPLDR